MSYFIFRGGPVTNSSVNGFDTSPTPSAVRARPTWFPEHLPMVNAFTSLLGIVDSLLPCAAGKPDTFKSIFVWRVAASHREIVP
jgi:hypothetical protein